MTERLDWGGMMRVGLMRLGLRPDDFWRLSPAELALMTGVGGGERPMSRATLSELVRAWPDGAGAEMEG